MEWIAKPEGTVRRLGLLPAAFNPPTLAHLALAEGALGIVDQVLLVLPRAFPHKQYVAATMDDRAAMLRRIAAGRQRIGAAISEGGLFLDIVREAREHYPEAGISVICGRDAAERIIGWDYGHPGAIHAMLAEFHLLVAARQGVYVPPHDVQHAVQLLSVGQWDECSSTRVREMAEGWRSLVPPEIADIVERLYSPDAEASRNARSR